MTNKNIVTGLLVGAGVGMVAGLLMTDKGSEIRKKIKKSGGSVLDFIFDALNKGKKAIKEYSETTETVQDLKKGTSTAS